MRFPIKHHLSIGKANMFYSCFQIYFSKVLDFCLFTWMKIGMSQKVRKHNFLQIFTTFSLLLCVELIIKGRPK